MNDHSSDRNIAGLGIHCRKHFAVEPAAAERGTAIAVARTGHVGCMP
jgi:hypothetical protein